MRAMPHTFATLPAAPAIACSPMMRNCWKLRLQLCDCRIPVNLSQLLCEKRSPFREVRVLTGQMKFTCKVQSLDDNAEFE
ncbi:hypothetical protein BO85DRAFT_132007 [Aspergillus piperis CBS 112811]|uniref:Uncharacterized protein n=1 Tax=Aspergillus piperis CBS 112811 TaxID=1448313 RepID=A0A8G1RC48_9EURO|nr:hypothetical protein BO85DRAFT_132007 [Aspergillus piperis CBS 112811]RAH62337.1 hypothetical protein BO85DRAFT_132007 [Aspergillus piperis CBS 112811]